MPAEPRPRAGVSFADAVVFNQRVAGSIPALAAISNSMIRNGSRASPADYPCPDGTDPRTVGRWVGRGSATSPRT